VAPVAIPPPAAPYPANDQACAKPKAVARQITRVIIRIIRIHRGAVDVFGIVRWNIDDFGIGWLDHDYLFSTFDCLRFHFLVPVGL
jgi:hypothetical protein